MGIPKLPPCRVDNSRNVPISSAIPRLTPGSRFGLRRLLRSAAGHLTGSADERRPPNCHAKPPPKLRLILRVFASWREAFSQTRTPRARVSRVRLPTTTRDNRERHPVRIEQDCHRVTVRQRRLRHDDLRPCRLGHGEAPAKPADRPCGQPTPPPHQLRERRMIHAEEPRERP